MAVSLCVHQSRSPDLRYPPFGADIALMPARIWLAHIGMFGAE
jgi:hypothetical protein